MTVSIWSTLVLYTILSAAQQVDCFIDLESENGYSPQKTDIAEPIPDNTELQIRHTSQQPNVAELIENNPIVRTRSARTVSYPDPLSDRTERIDDYPIVRTRTRESNSNTNHQSGVAERIEDHPVVRAMPLRTNNNKNSRHGVARRIDHGPIVKTQQIRLVRPQSYQPVHQPKKYNGKVQKRRHTSRGNSKDRTGIFTGSGSDVADVHRPFEHIDYKFDMQFIFPGMRSAKKRKHVLHNTFYEMFEKYFQKSSKRNNNK